MSKIHRTRPVRRVVAVRNTYQEYRPELRNDFNGSCGYCGDSDEFLDKICFHIDHFAPKKKFPHLKTTYTNLVYACRFCNIKKSNHWIGDDANVSHDGTKGFVDPCAEEFDDHVGRDGDGKIVGKTELGRYIVKRLNLGLVRHQLLWQAREARRLIEAINQILDRVQKPGTQLDEGTIQLLVRFRELTNEIHKYEALAAA